nr:uncharacterized protein LOC109182188 isoform X1 [Ipomoea trifida]
MRSSTNSITSTTVARSNEDKLAGVLALSLDQLISSPTTHLFITNYLATAVDFHQRPPSTSSSHRPQPQLSISLTTADVNHGLRGKVRRRPSAIDRGGSFGGDLQKRRDNEGSAETSSGAASTCDFHRRRCSSSEKPLYPGSFKPSRHQDVLSEALGKKEHPGSVRGVGAYVAVKKVFGKPMKSKERSRGVLAMDDVEALVEKVRQETILAMQPTIDSLNNQLQDLMKRMPQEYPENVRASMGTPQSMYKPVDPLVGRSSCQSVDPYPFALIESPTPCRLALCTGKDTIVVVARGIVHPTQFDTLVHNTLVLPNHVKVSVDHVIVEGGETFLLPVPSQYHTHIGDVIGSFVQWPTHLVGIGEV